VHDGPGNDVSNGEEARRLAALYDFSILDTVPERAYDDITEIASFICDTPIALISLVDEKRQWFKSEHGLGARETPRSESFCAHTIPTAEMLIVEDASLDVRFRENPLVLGDPSIRFYAGAPIIERDGHVLGTVCVIDSKPRVLNARQISALEALARQVTMLLEQRRMLAEQRVQQARLSEAQETLTESEDRLSLAVEAAGFATWFYEPARNVVGGDAKMAELFGVAEMEGPVESWLAPVHLEDRERVNREFEASISGEPYDTEYRVLVGGSVRWIRAKARVSLEDDRHRMVGICENVTARKLTEGALASTAERLRLAQSAGRIASWEWELSTGAMIWDGGSQWIYGRPPAETDQADKLFSYVEPEDVAELEAALRPALAGQGEFSVRFRVNWPNGTVHWIEARGMPVLFGEGPPARLVGINVDVTEQRLAANALIQSEKLAAVGRLASSIAHEINNPLESVTNLVYLARTSEDMTDIRTYLNAADSELRRTSAIANQTLRFHKQSSNPVAVHCEELIAGVLTVQQSRIQNARVKVEKRKRASRPVLCFDGEIRQVLNNLVGNAVDAMHGTGGRLLIRSRESQDWRTGRAGLVLTVADTGEGMSQSTLGKLFNAFFTTKGIGGTGLGLWVSQEIIDRHHGRLAVRSSQRAGCSGTVFTVFLPFDAIRR
jgi:PAS domain S-box-containing protein